VSPTPHTYVACVRVRVVYRGEMDDRLVDGLISYETDSTINVVMCGIGG
jgi:hypothetical protein